VFGIPFDLKRLAVTGPAVPVIEGVRRSQGTSRFGGGTATTQFSVSETGSLAYVAGAVGPTPFVAQQELSVFDRTGAAHALKAPAGAYGSPRLSPNAQQIVLDTDDGTDANIWIYDLSGTSSMRRLTFGGRNRMPIWSSDSRHVAFQSDRDGDLAIFWQLADGTGTAERLTTAETGTVHAPLSWSPDADLFLFEVAKRGGNTSLWMFSLADRKARALGVADSIQATGAVFSPDGRWVAYSSKQVRQPNDVLYVQPFPPTGAKYQVSKDSEDGHHPVWLSKGRELLFTTGPAQFAIVRATTTPGFAVGVAEPSVGGKMALLSSTSTRPYDVAPDGTGLIGLTAPDQTGSPIATQIQIVLNWFEELNRLVPTGRR
jgi:serine/threonine-protein kinase